MNNLLQLKGKFQQADSKNKPQGSKLPTGKCVETSKLEKLLKNLKDLKEFWLKEELISGALISVYYNKVAAKSNRIKGLLSKGSKMSANSSVVGARFSDHTSPKHIITHYVSIEILDESILRLEKSIEILNKKFNNKITDKMLESANLKKIDFSKLGIVQTTFQSVIVDSYYVDKFDVLNNTTELKTESIITIFKTDINTIQLMEKIGIDLQFNKIMDNTTILLRPDQLALLTQKAPYLISMAVSDLTQLFKENFSFYEKKTISIPSPKSEPIIGVIDTMFDENVYFSEWVEFKNMLSKEIPLTSKDYIHGTAVTSIIVDGPAFNSNLDDGCGRFRVRHFGVAGNQFSSFTILRNINEIITKNKDIKVWNLSLGSTLEINKNFISPEAAILDKIQFENNVIFIIAGTNNSEKETKYRIIGSPADSINSLVVNSVALDGQPVDYARKGPVLSFFIKPDVSYYGGDKKNPMRVCTSTGESFVRGTSFAAPWLARKMSYLIEILGLSREIAKALIINSATGWGKQEIDSCLIGHGVVPIKIQDIIKCQDDEIQFVLSGISEKYDTFNYNIPVPIANGKYPYIAKATLCYFPCCSRNQGVDYTNTELDIKFGRVHTSGVKSIDNNYQSDETDSAILEKDARALYRKWDNIKHIRETYTEKNGAKKIYPHGLWGISLKTKERLDKKYGTGLKFGMVVTLKEINGVNRVDDFVKQCYLNRWFVDTIDIESKINIFNIAEEEIEFDI